MTWEIIATIIGALGGWEAIKYLIKGKPFGKPLVGAGGEFQAHYCNTFANLAGKQVPQFLIADIDNVAASIKRETGISIQGVLSLSQMKMAGIQIDANDNLIIIE